MKKLFSFLKNLILSSFFCMLGTGIAVAQSMIIAPPIYVKGGPVGGTVVCRIFRHGSSILEPLGYTHIYSNVSTQPLPLSVNSCKKSGLGLHESCVFAAKITGNYSYTCRFGSAGNSGARYSGTIEIQDSQFNVLAREAMGY